MINEAKARELLSTLSDTTSYPWRPIPSRDLAKKLGISIQTLANWRMRETGPPHESYERGQGNRTYYRPDKVMAWLSELSGEPRELWEFAHLHLIRKKGLDNLPLEQPVVEHVMGIMDRQDPVPPRRAPRRW